MSLGISRKVATRSNVNIMVLNGFAQGQNGFAQGENGQNTGIWNDGNGNFFACGGQFPSNFFCPVGTECIALVSDYSATLCCPSQSDCSPISCDAQQWNVTSIPQSTVHSSATVSLAQCGEGCCPIGYSCQANRCLKESTRQQLVQTSQGSTLTTQTKTSQISRATKSPSSTVIRVAPGAHPSNTSTLHPSPKTASGAMTTTTWALVGVLGFMFVCLAAVLGWYFYRRRKAGYRNIDAGKSRESSTSYEKPELDSREKRLPLRSAEMDAIPSPKELLVPPRVLELNAVRSPRELPGHPERPRTLNSVCQELDAASLKHWMVGTDEWI